MPTTISIPSLVSRMALHQELPATPALPEADSAEVVLPMKALQRAADTAAAWDSMAAEALDLGVDAGARGGRVRGPAVSDATPSIRRSPAERKSNREARFCVSTAWRRPEAVARVQTGRLRLNRAGEEKN